ncbi:MAG: DNA adenine methylase [Methanolinea sp.]|nr:DNA adenine methylase [Methanolinea sp.]
MRVPSPRPFLKWAGGKTQLLPALAERVPKKVREGQVPVYVEPFVGGGAVYFHFNSRFRFRECHIFDVNEELFLAYTVVRDRVEELIEVLQGLAGDFLSRDGAGRQEYYREVRDAFNRRRKTVTSARFHPSWIERAAQLIFLNRTCYNGLFRVNSRGEFNVPFGRYKNPLIVNEPLLRRDSMLLQNTSVHLGDFAQSLPTMSEGTFAYFDPPYRPISKTARFTAYSEDGFSDADQERLARFFAACNARGALLMLSNSDPKNTDPEDDFFDRLYGDFFITRVPARRAINSDGGGRGRISEVVVTNYPTGRAGTLLPG